MKETIELLYLFLHKTTNRTFLSLNSLKIHLWNKVAEKKPSFGPYDSD